MSRYGDVDQVRQDVKTLNEIQARQGSNLLIDIIAESCGEAANKFQLNSVERRRLLNDLVEELREAILERI